MQKNVLSLFSGCGGMDIGLEGNFTCLAKSVNETLHPEWVKEHKGIMVKLAPTSFKTVFANDIRPDAKAAWVNYFASRNDDPNSIYHIDSIVDLVKQHKNGEKVFPKVDVVTGGFPCCDFSVSGWRGGFNSHKDHLGRPITSDVPSIESRGSLYMWMRDVITIAQPKLLFQQRKGRLAWRISL